MFDIFTWSNKSFSFLFFFYALQKFEFIGKMCIIAMKIISQNRNKHENTANTK